MSKAGTEQQDMDEALKRVCPNCKQKTLAPVWGTEPWSIDHWGCENCDSTYTKGDPAVGLDDEGVAKTFKALSKDREKRNT